MMSSAQDSIARFASLSSGVMGEPAQRAGFLQTFLAPFRDIDQRPARLAAASRAEREMRHAAMSAAAAPRR
jgi:hypothetical protein